MGGPLPTWRVASRPLNEGFAPAVGPGGGKPWISASGRPSTRAQNQEGGQGWSGSSTAISARECRPASRYGFEHVGPAAFGERDAGGAARSRSAAKRASSGIWMNQVRLDADAQVRVAFSKAASGGQRPRIALADRPSGVLHGICSRVDHQALTGA